MAYSQFCGVVFSGKQSENPTPLSRGDQKSPYVLYFKRREVYDIIKQFYQRRKRGLQKVQKRHVPIFTSVTNEALPYLAVTLKSISDFTGEGCVSDVRVLTSGLAAYNQRKLRHLSLPRVSISIVDINRRVEDYRADFEERLGYSEQRTHNLVN